MEMLLEAHYEKTINEEFMMHTHNAYEIYCFVSGDAEYVVEGNRYRLSPGDIMLMRKNETHHLVLKSTAYYERSYIYFDFDSDTASGGERRVLDIFNARPLGKFNHYKASLFPDNRWKYYIEKICSYSDPTIQRMYLFPLLNELYECFETIKSEGEESKPDHTAGIIKYINRHLTDELNLDMIAEKFYISKTHLNRVFKRSAGSTVWEYITVKRLLIAQEMLRSGRQPTEVYLACGFKDYTAFFRAYKRRFGVSPKNEMAVKNTP